MKLRDLCICGSTGLGILLGVAGGQVVRPNAGAEVPVRPNAGANPPVRPNAGGAANVNAEGAGGAAAGTAGGAAAVRTAQRVVDKLVEAADVPVWRIDQAWYGRHDQNVQRAKRGNVDLYMLGDSITDNWGGANVNGGGGNFAASWNKYVAGWNAANFAISGDRTEQVLWRLKNGELDVIKPKVVVILLGTNNLPASQYSYAPVSPEEAAKGYKAVLDVVREKQPQAKVLMVSVFPRADQEQEVINDRVKKLNGLISKYADGKEIVYLDIYDKFLGADGKLKPGIMPDSLHPNAAGYDIWGAAMMPKLTEWLGPPKAPAVELPKGLP